MQLKSAAMDRNGQFADGSIGRIVSVTGSKAIVLLDAAQDGMVRDPTNRPEMGTLLAIETAKTIVLAIVSALNVPVPAQREGEMEIWIAELGLVGELKKGKDNKPETFNRGVTIYPALGDRVRVAVKSELQIAFCGDMEKSVRVGTIRQDSSIPAMIRVDDLLGKHFAILGTTGTGKSCTTALVLRSILERNPAAHIVLLDPHNEYSTAFPEWGEVISPRNMQLPFWLLTFEELVEVVIGDSAEKKQQEIEMMQELIPIAKSRYSTGRGKEQQSVRTRILDTGKFTVDTPVPYRISDLTSLIDERMGKLENKRDIAPYRNLKTRFETLSMDPRYSFMFGSLTVFDGMAQILSRLFRVPVNGKPITILELTGLPTEIVNVVVSVICRMTFDFALWSEGKVPVTLVCEEAHRYVPANPALGFEPCKRSIAKIAKEGRKYGASLCIVTQRPAEIDPTILSQCNTVFALRMSNDRDQEIVTSSISDTGSGLLEFLSALGQREAIAFGEGVALPVRIRFDELPKHCMPRSSSAKFTDMWQQSAGDEGFLESIVERWRLASSGPIGDANQQMAMLADSVGVTGQAELQAAPRVVSETAGLLRPREMVEPAAYMPAAAVAPAAQQRTGDPVAAAPAQPVAPARATLPGMGNAPRREPVVARREPVAAGAPGQPAPAPAGGGNCGALRSLRDRLSQRR
ncbi:MAG: ATP-binding protein [Hyphomicrobiaceae bacterium]